MKQKIKIEVEGLKVEPLKFFMEKEGKQLDDEIIKAIDDMYVKFVPAQTREYIDFQVNDELPSSLKKEAKNAKTEEVAKTEKKQKATKVEKTPTKAMDNTKPVEDKVEEVVEVGMAQRM